MQVLTPRIDLSAFLSRIAEMPARVLMLDYDGTLAPFHVRPECAIPYPDVAAMLEQIVESGRTRVVIVSGRPAHELPPLLGLSKSPEIWGSHGWERVLPDGRRIIEEPEREARAALEQAGEAIRTIMPEGARLEEKLASIALHWRAMPQAAAAQLRGAAEKQWQSALRTKTVEMLPFDGGIELRAIGCNKQYAVKAVLAETADESAVAYLGDDLTDEDAFRAVKPRGIGVLVRPEFRETGADVWLRPPHELTAFLAHWRAKSQ